MKLLLDETLSPRLIGLLSDLYPGSAHVRQCGLGSADDAPIGEHPETHGSWMVSKDSDDQVRRVLILDHQRSDK